MSKIYEALEYARREKGGLKKQSGVPLSERHTLNTLRLNMENEMIDLHHSIESILSSLPKKAIQFIGSREGEGTSTIASELAMVSAIKFGKSVLLLGKDNQKTIHPFFINFKPVHGLDEVILDNIPLDDSLCRVGETNLFISLLSLYSATSQIFSSPRMDYLWSNLQQRFDLIIVDSSPATLSPDGSAISQRVDGTVLVLEAEKTRWPVAESVKDKITNNGGKILGVVFNKRRYYIPEFIYKKL